MSKAGSGYEVIPHGLEEFPIAIFSEGKYEVEPHYHKEYELFFLREGSMRVGINGEECILSKGNAVMIEPGVYHYAYGVEGQEHWHFHSLLFDAAALGTEQDPARKIIESVKINRFLIFPEALLARAEEMFQNTGRHDFGAELLLKTYLYQMLAHLIETKQYTGYADYRNNQSRAGAVINTALRYIEQHYYDRISIDEILARVSYSRSHFIRLFRQKTGLSFVDYLNKYRIEKSCVELIYTNKAISDIAVDNGFNNVQYFSRVFRQYMNSTPAKYRSTAMRLQRS